MSYILIKLQPIALLFAMITLGLMSFNVLPASRELITSTFIFVATAALPFIENKREK